MRRERPPHEPKTCFEKQAYVSRSKARAAAKKIRRNNPGIKMDYYKCPNEDHYHLTTQEQKRRRTAEENL